MRPALLHGLVSLLAVACAPDPSDPSPAAALPADEARPAPAIASSARAQSAPPAASAPPAPAPAAPTGTARYDLRFEDAGLPELTRAISAITGKRFVLGGPLPPIKASLYSPDQVTAEEAYQAFLTVLVSNGLTVVPRGRFLAIVPSPGVGR